MNSTILILVAITIIAAVFIERKLQVPLGIVCMLGAFLIGYYGLGLGSKQVAGFFPTTVVLPLILASAYFMVFSSNGTTQVIANKILGVLKGRMFLFPIIVFVLSWLLYTFLEGSALRYIITPMIFSIATAGGLNPYIAISTAYLSYVAGGCNPWLGLDAITRVGVLTDMGLQNPSNISLAIWLNVFLALVFTQLIFYFVTGSFKVPNIPFEVTKEKQELNTVQKKSMGLILFTVVMFVFPPLLKSIVPCDFTAKLADVFNVYVVFLIGIALIKITGVSNWNEMAKTVSIKPIIMIAGVTMLVKVASEAGMQEFFVGVTQGVPSWLIGPVLLLVCALLSFFVAAPTVTPMMFPIAIALADTPAKAIAYLSCIVIGLASSGVSPISNSGAAFLSTVEDNKKEAYSNKMFICAFLFPITMAIFVALGGFSIFSNLLSGWFY